MEKHNNLKNRYFYEKEINAILEYKQRTCFQFLNCITVVLENIGMFQKKVSLYHL